MQLSFVIVALALACSVQAQQQPITPNPGDGTTPASTPNGVVQTSPGGYTPDGVNQAPPNSTSGINQAPPATATPDQGFQRGPGGFLDPFAGLPRYPMSCEDAFMPMSDAELFEEMPNKTSSSVSSQDFTSEKNRGACKTPSNEAGGICDSNSCSGFSSCTNCVEMTFNGNTTVHGTQNIPQVDCRFGYFFDPSAEDKYVCMDATQKSYSCGACDKFASCAKCVKMDDPAFNAS